MSEARVLPLQTQVLCTLQACIQSYRMKVEPKKEVLDQLMSDMRRLLDEQGALELRSVGQFLLVNGERFPRLEEERLPARRLGRALERHALEGLRFEPGLDDDELRPLLRILAARRSRRSREAPPSLRGSDFQHVVVLRRKTEALFQPAGVGMSVHRSVAGRLYLRALQLVEEWSNAEQQQDRPPLHPFQAVLQRMIDLTEEDDAALLGLTCVKNLETHATTHPVNVAILSIVLGQAAQLGRKDLLKVGLAAILHDVGQLDVPEDVLSHRGTLSQEQWSSLRRHTLHGAARLFGMAALEVAVPIALTALEHHMGVAGDGYPRVFRGATPSLISRIVHIADTYDALTSRRVLGQQAIRPDRAMAFIMQNANATFDTTLVKLFVQVHGLYPPGTTVRLDSGEVCVVVRASRKTHLLHRPQVCVILQSDGTPAGRDLYLDLAETRKHSGDYRRHITETLDPESLEIVPAEVFLPER